MNIRNYYSVNTAFMKKSSIFGVITFAFFTNFASGQTLPKGYTVVTTAVPFLSLTPDSKAASMGEAGAASAPDANALYWNTAKLAYSEDKFGSSFSYAPWLRDIVQDMGIMSANAYYKLSDKQTIGAGVTYFDQGDIQFTNAFGANLAKFHSKEYAVTFGISTKLSSDFAMGLNFKFINSNLVGSTIINGQAGKPGRTGAFDLGFYYNKTRPTDKNSDKPKKTDFDYGAVIQNIGGKVNYGFGQYFIPANFKIGTKISHRPDELNTFTFLLDFNKLLVPTPKANTPITDKSILSTMFTSWSDAPNGMREELSEVMTSIGAEYSYADLISLRTGYFYESPDKGGRQYFTTGFGITLKDIYKLDMAYLIPTNAGNPLANTWRVSLNIGLSSKKSAETGRDLDKE
jgi:hypothetical protein